MRDAIALHAEAKQLSPRDHSFGARSRILLASIVVIAYSPVVFATYGVSDDYRLLYGFQRGHTEVAHALLGNGRQGMLVLEWIASLGVDDVAGMRWWRLVTILGLAA